MNLCRSLLEWTLLTNLPHQPGDVLTSTGPVYIISCQPCLHIWSQLSYFFKLNVFYSPLDHPDDQVPAFLCLLPSCGSSLEEARLRLQWRRWQALHRRDRKAQGGGSWSLNHRGRETLRRWIRGRGSSVKGNSQHRLCWLRTDYFQEAKLDD